MLRQVMQPPGTFKIHRRPRPRAEATGRAEPVDADFVDPLACLDTRTQRIVDSLRDQILEAGDNLRIRQVFREPRAIYRIEIDVPDMNYQRTTLLDGDALEELLEIDEIRNRISDAL
jgi:hypothetical protein